MSVYSKKQRTLSSAGLCLAFNCLRHALLMLWCFAGAPAFCESKAVVGGPPVCVRAESIVSMESLALIQSLGVSSTQISEECSQVAVLEAYAPT